MADPIPLRPPPCPICAKASVHATRPFCSTVCKNEDLRRWLSGTYKMPGEEPIQPEEPEAGDKDR